MGCAPSSSGGRPQSQPEDEAEPPSVPLRTESEDMWQRPLHPDEDETLGHDHSAVEQPSAATPPAKGALPPVKHHRRKISVEAGPARGAGDGKRRAERMAVREPDAHGKRHDQVVSPTPKDAAQIKRIIEGFRQHIFFAHLRDETLQVAALAMREKSVARGSVIIEQGDPKAEHFYVVECGDVHVFVDSVYARTMTSGTGFGELALLYGLPRSARCVAASDCKLWELGRVPFRQIMVGARTTERELHMSFLKSVPLFAELSTKKRSRLADALRDEDFKRDDIIIEQGETGDKFYLIQKGHVLITDEVAQSMRAIRRNAGDYFGELALIKDAVRTARVTAGEDCHVLTLDRSRFQKLFQQGEIDFRQYGKDALPSAQRVSSSAHLAIEIQVQKKREKKTFVSSLQGVKLSIASFERGPSIGEGAFGNVWLGRYVGAGEASGRTYAVKAMRKDFLIQHAQTAQVLTELQVLRGCHHPFVVVYAGHWQDRRYLYMVMEYVRGGELYSVLQTCGELPQEEARLYAAEIVLALEYLHLEGVVYRDLKPENLLLDSLGHIKVVDFGLSKRMDGCDHDEHNVQAGMQEHKTYTLCGTMSYMAPEIILNKGHDAGVDFWALGVVLYELLTGLPPFYSNDNMTTINMIVKRRIAWPEGMDGNARDLIDKLLQVNTVDRFGCLADGVEDVKTHYWMKGLDWEKVLARGYTMPFVPSKLEADAPVYRGLDEQDTKNVANWSTRWFRQDSLRVPEFDERGAPVVSAKDDIAYFADF